MRATRKLIDETDEEINKCLFLIVYKFFSSYKTIFSELCNFLKYYLLNNNRNYSLN